MQTSSQSALAAEVIEAVGVGADTVLLMVSVLPVSALRQLLATARGLGVEPLVEVRAARHQRLPDI